MGLAELTDAVEAHRRGYASDPDGYAEQLADALRELADTYEDERRYEEALAPAREAVAVAQRALAPTRGRADWSLSRALKTLTRVAQALGRPEIAVDAVLESSDACQRLAASEPGAFDEWLVRRLHDHQGRLLWLGAAEPALATVEEAAAIYRRLVAVDPRRYYNGYRTALDILAGQLNSMGRRAEALAVRREAVARLTPESPIEELDFTIPTYVTLKRLGCHRIGDVARLGVPDVLYQPVAARWIPDDINQRLALMDLGPLGPAATRARTLSIPPAPEWTFGALCVLCPGDDAVAQVREAVIAAYAADGAHPVDQDAYIAASDEHAEGLICDLRINDSPRLGTDLVIIDPEAAAWIAVKSEHGELAPQGRHPLALRLSQRWPVLSVTATKGVAYELCLYFRGAPAQYAAHGNPAGPPPVDVPLDLELLASQSWISASASELREVFGEPTVFANLAGISSGGLRSLFEGAPLSDVPEDRVLFLLRRPTGRPDDAGA